MYAWCAHLLPGRFRTTMYRSSCGACSSARSCKRSAYAPPWCCTPFLLDELLFLPHHTLQIGGFQLLDCDAILIIYTTKLIQMVGFRYSGVDRCTYEDRQKSECIQALLLYASRREPKDGENCACHDMHSRSDQTDRTETTLCSVKGLTCLDVCGWLWNYLRLMRRRPVSLQQ